MSRPRNEPPAPVAGPDGATMPVGGVATGVVKTTKGYAVVTVTISRSGGMSLRLGNSQAFKEHVSVEQKRAALREALRA